MNQPTISFSIHEDKEKEIKKIALLDGERKLYKSLYSSGNELYIVLGATDMIPRYVSDGSNELMGIKKDDIMLDKNNVSLYSSCKSSLCGLSFNI